jgi:hypothetical protein
MKDVILYGVLASLGLGMGATWMISPKVPVFAVVDTGVLISQRAQKLAKIHGTKINPQQIQEVSEHLKDDLKSFAQVHQVILLTKGAVVGGALPDLTDEFLSKGDN